MISMYPSVTGSISRCTTSGLVDGGIAVRCHSPSAADGSATAVVGAGSLARAPWTFNNAHVRIVASLVGHQAVRCRPRSCIRTPEIARQNRDCSQSRM